MVSVDQTPIRGSLRSNPATYTGLLDPICTAFAKANGVKPALFSANTEGACPSCNGAVCNPFAVLPESGRVRALVKKAAGQRPAAALSCGDRI